jgi:hypothetical protein
VSTMKGNSVAQAGGAVVRRFLYEVARLDPNFKRPNSEQKEEILKHFKYRCAYCNVSLVEIKFDWDHIIPRNKKDMGLNVYNNIAPACIPCNRGEKGVEKGKSSKPWRKYLEERNKTKPYIHSVLLKRLEMHLIKPKHKLNFNKEQLERLYQSVSKYAARKIQQLLKESESK